ncbi:Signal transduction histidine kinase EnvZ-like, dimerization/phosphoacceptor domain protein [Kalmanozyma brasiliensis GHG001]|uniref:histidine kinase n=1 Tax=Kalmanozyma brasiliensis (strain GHG001) TaxID=1365824 RepID=V5E5B5_KALBG|nr:Signal transduction histidine kinase EnvZ-like, dimerization/phosphoacceptor domain protein [Kalmanozyma brasiliensis GHG001]EST05406.1 Signal transduction histidine kinase EnvZ-like, dimerization/phosphoacceptor domain protein [Kalmanozyma brasiliensis GHG001]
MTGSSSFPHDEWGTWLRRYQLGDWDPRAVVNAPDQPTDPITVVRTNSGSPTAPIRHAPPAPLAGTEDPLRLDPNLDSQSRSFFQQNGWLAAPPLRQQHRRRVLEAIHRHGVKASKDLLLHVKHAKSVFKCAYASVIVQTFDEASLLILAQDGGDSLVQHVPQTVSLCSHAMLLPDDEVFVINNTTDDWRFRSCPSTLAGSAASALGRPMNFYASAPLILSYTLDGVEGLVQVGRLCIMDEEPRSRFEDQDAELLSSIAKMAADSLEKDFQSSRNAKATDMQRRIGSLVRLVDNTSISQAKVHLPPSILAGSGDDYHRFSSAVLERGCNDLKDCLGAAAVAAFDVSQFRLGRRPANDALEASSTTTSPILHQVDSTGCFDHATQPAVNLPHTGPSDADRASRPAKADTALHAIDVRPGSSPPSLLGFSGPQEYRPKLPTNVEDLKAIFATPLARSATETNMNTRCKFYRRQSGPSAHYQEVDDQSFYPVLETGENPYIALLPLDDRVTSYAVCTSYDQNKSRPGIMLLIMFTAPVSFEEPERSYVETTTQISFGSLLRQERSSVESFQSEFLRHVQHNLRTPLHRALGAVDYLRAAIDVDDSTDSIKLDLSANGVLSTLLESISLSGLTLNSYIDDLLSFQTLLDLNEGVVPPIKPSPTNIVKLVESIADEEWDFAQRLELQSRSVGSSTSQGALLNALELIVQASPEIRERDWIVDGKSLQHIVRKLVSNALRFTKQGYVEISIAIAAPIAGIEGIVHAFDASSQLEIVVADTGVGMTEEFCKNQLTTPFSKADSFRDGIGLGMAIVSSELEKCGGTWSVVSEVNVGTRMSVQLPVQPTRTQYPRARSSEVDQSSNASRLAVAKVAFLGFETRGLDRLATAIFDHFAPLGGLETTHDHAEADCIIMPEREATKLDSGPEPFLAHVKPDARFVVISSSYLTKKKGLEKFDGRAVLLLSTPHGPTSMRLMETFLSDLEPMQIRTADPAPNTLQHRPSVIGTELLNHDKHHRNGTDCSSQSESGLRPHDGAAVVLQDTIGSFSVNPAWQGMAVEASNNEFRVLVVEDNPINMKLLTTLCKRLNIRYEEACDGAEAVTKFESFRPSVVLLDISLPVQDGFQACTQMRATNHPSFIVAVTALGSEEDKARGIEVCGMDAWMTKPVSMRQLKADLEFWKRNFEQQQVLGLRRTSF